MAIEVYLIRHGKTAGNLRGAYIGRTDEPLCPEGMTQIEENLAEGLYPAITGRLFASPLKRCVETAALIFPRTDPELVEGLRETDFGEFEGKSYAQLNGNPDYQRWIDSGGSIPFPGGEAPDQFRARCTAAFREIMAGVPDGGQAVIVCHGGTIMAVLDAFSTPHQDFYAWQVKNGGGFCGLYEPETGSLCDIIPLAGQEEQN